MKQVIKPNLDELIDQMREDNAHGEVSSGTAMGDEFQHFCDAVGHKTAKTEEEIQAAMKQAARKAWRDSD